MFVMGDVGGCRRLRRSCGRGEQACQDLIDAINA
jgi:hypothetical protein